MTIRTNTRSGNILIYILGGIVLLGILISLLRGNFQEGTGVDQEQILIKTTQVQRYASELERGVGYILQNGLSESDIRFAHANAPSNYGLITDNPKRQVFSPLGGGVEYQNPLSGINDGTMWQFYATTHIKDMGTDLPASNSKSELVAVLPKVTQAFCSRINFVNGQSIDLSTISDTGSCINAGAANVFTGTYVDGAGANTLVDAAFTKTPAKEACVKCADGTFNYYRVLLAR